MRLRIWLVIASLSTCASHNSLAIAQNGATSSTIRLASGSAPVVRNEIPESTTRQPAVRHAAFTAPAPQPAQADVQGPSFAPPRAAPATGQPSMTMRPRMPAGLYATPPAMVQMPGPAPVQSAPRLQATRPGGKPFSSFAMQPAISPYLYLNAGTGTSQLTNYLAHVKPQLDQMETNQQQQREIQQLRNQVQKMSTSGGGTQRSSRPNAAAHYMDTAQFYRGLQR